MRHPPHHSRTPRPNRPPQGPRYQGAATTDLRPVTYRHRNVVERCFNQLNHRRDLATRYAKRASIYRAGLVIIAALI